LHATTAIYTLSLHDALPISLVFSEAITNQNHLLAALQPSLPGQVMNGRGGGIGPGLPGTLGAQLACPDRKVVGVCSDGAAMYSIDRKSTRLNSSHVSISYAV